MIQEDWEFEAQMDDMYLQERQNDIEQEHYNWLQEQENIKRHPAKIEILIPESVTKTRRNVRI